MFDSVLHISFLIYSSFVILFISFLCSQGEVLVHAPAARYPGILLVSSQRLYILKITGPEEGDRVDRWISRVVAIPRENLQSITALPWDLGICLSLQGSSLNNLSIVVRDPHSQLISIFEK
jgi:hypothetical protein